MTVLHPLRPYHILVVSQEELKWSTLRSSLGPLQKYLFIFKRY